MFTVTHHISKNTLRRVTQTLLAVAVLLGLLLPAVQPAQAAACTQYHTVKAGETLFSIGLKYGYLWTTLADMNDIANPRLIYAGQVLCVGTEGSVTPPSPAVKPTFQISRVVKDQSVTIQTAKFPANDSFEVLMGAYGTLGINGIKVATLQSGNGGSFSASFNIPAALVGSKRIAIRLQSPTSGYFSYNWFYNSSSDTNTGGVIIPNTGYGGYPTFSILSVAAGQSVTIQTNNLPPNVQFNVLMGKIGTQGINGTALTSFDSGKGGSQTLTFDIPSAYQDDFQVAIRLESPKTGYFAYNWFYNN